MGAIHHFTRHILRLPRIAKEVESAATQGGRGLTFRVGGNLAGRFLSQAFEAGRETRERNFYKFRCVRGGVVR